MLIQFSFFGAYFVMSFPSGFLVEKLGYRNGIIIGLATAGVGCLGFYPAASLQSYPLFLGALFVLASGITLLQVAANPYVAVLGRPETSASRLNLTQAFNSLGTTIGPFMGSVLILAAVSGDGATDAAREIETVQGPYLALAAVLFLIAIVFAQFKLPVVPQHRCEQRRRGAASRCAASGQYSHLVLGAVAIFVYVGAEVSIGSFLVNFMSQPEIGGLTESEAGRYLSLYWGGAMVGRFIGSYVLRKVKPGYVLAFNAAVRHPVADRRDELGAAVSRCGRCSRSACSTRSCSRRSSRSRSRSSAATPARVRACCAWRSSAARSCRCMQGYFADHHGHSHVVLRAGDLLRVHRVLRPQGSRSAQCGRVTAEEVEGHCRKGRKNAQKGRRREGRRRECDVSGRIIVAESCARVRRRASSGQAF